MLGFGLKVAFIGIAVVFAALVFLIVVINLMSKAAGTKETKKPEPVPAAPIPEAEPIKAEENENEDEIAAVIAAAVACLSRGTLRITAITPLSGQNAPAWSMAGRQETMNLRQL